MNIDDFLNQAESYNQDSDTITGFFNLDDDETRDKLHSVADTAREVDTKSEIMMKIDAVTDTKIEAIVVASLFYEAIAKASSDDEVVLPMKIAMALSMCVSKDLMSIDEAEKASEIFSKVFSSL